jgi:anthranilate synthase component I
MYHPSRDDFVAAARQGNLIPVYREIVADGDTPVSAYAKLGRTPYSFLLESVVGGETWAAYSFIGVQPLAVLRCRAGRAELTWYGDGAISDTRSWEARDPTAALAEVMAGFRPVPVAGLPRFWGGAVGWIGYEVVRAFERLPERRAAGTPGAGPDIPDLCMVFTDTLVIFDNLRQTVKVVACAHVPADAHAEAVYERALARIDEIVARLHAPAAPLAPLLPPPAGEAGSAALRWGGESEPWSRFAQPEFMAAVERIRGYILAGDIFQAVLSQRLEIPRVGPEPIDLFDVYRALRIINPSPYMFHLAYPEAEVTGASPETLVRCADGRVEVRPIAGTRPRGRDAAEDERLAAELLADPKERAEHLMLVDLGRNDVGRVSEIGSVKVSDFMVVERYSHVMHLVSHVHGRLAPGLGWHDVLRAAFPAGTLSGAPKIRAMQIIDELEPHGRGIYGGAVGYVSYTGNMDAAIAIRTLVGTEGAVYVQAGAGIVHDSDPVAEYEETLNKARALLRAVALARQSRAAAGRA